MCKAPPRIYVPGNPQWTGCNVDGKRPNILHKCFWLVACVYNWGDEHSAIVLGILLTGAKGPRGRT